MSELTAPSLVVYPPELLGPDGYPYAWHGRSARDGLEQVEPLYPAIKDYIRELADHRCERCHHPYRKGQSHPEWSECDEHCTHMGRVRLREAYRGDEDEWREYADVPQPVGDSLFDYDQNQRRVQRWLAEAAWRVLTVHHLTGEKADCRWWNLAALCQRCHLTIQGRVVMERAFILEHSDWMKPHAAGFYAVKYLGEDLSREETTKRLDELLALERLA